MPTKSVKKPTAKTTKTAKTATAKKTTTNRATTARRPATTRRPAKPSVDTARPVVEPVMEKCPCGHDCKCAPECHCGDNCHCGDGAKYTRGGFGRFMVKLIMILIVFALGFGVAKVLDDGRYFPGAHVDFDDGCLDTSSVKCPQLQLAVPIMDMDQDGCITRAEFDAVYAELHRQMRAEMDD